MRSAPLGRPLRGVVCLVAARGRGSTACWQCSGAVAAPCPPDLVSLPEQRTDDKNPGAQRHRFSRLSVIVTLSGSGFR